ncbi:hypothetical protein LINPERHAP1_LOCUS40959 [Linum perenne]
MLQVRKIWPHKVRFSKQRSFKTQSYDSHLE